jgi:hypothetical protein
MTRAPQTLKLAQPRSDRRFIKDLHVNLRTESGHIFSSSALLELRRQPLEIATHPGGSTC